VVKKALEGWQLASVTRVQTGSPLLFQSGRNTLNGNDSGVVLYTMNIKQLQEMMSIRKTTNAQGVGVVSFLPQTVIDNTQAAFEVGGKTLRDLDATKPYIGPASTAGQLEQCLFLYGPRQQKWTSVC
jgi:hypothetical protein